ncbi:MAG: hypothetical protein ACC700_14855 [Anaerolineales bacterium]
MRELELCEQDIVTFHVGKLLPGGSGGWNWRTLQYLQDCEDVLDPRDFLVDARGRVWIEGWNQVAVFDEAAFDSSETVQNPEILYTEDNSGYYMAHRLRIGPDERLWSLDIKWRCAGFVRPRC